MTQPELILKNLLTKFTEDQNYEDCDIEITPITSEGANYTSALYKAKVTARHHEDLHLFAKVATLSEPLREIMQGDKIFGTERFFYTDLAKVYESLQEKHNIPTEQRLITPKFFVFNGTYMEETIVLEDLNKKGYEMHDRFEPISWDYASHAVAELAKLHALSQAYKEEYPEDYTRESTKLHMTLNKPYDEVKDTWIKMAEGAYGAVGEEIRPRLEKFVTDICTEEQFAKYYGPGKFNWLVHGDYRSSNLLHSTENGKLTSLIPIDYQTIKTGSPASDLHYFIYSGTDAQFRANHLQQLLDHYYQCLATFLNRLGLDENTVYSRETFDEDFADMRPLGLLTAVFLLPLVMVEAANAPKLGDEGATMETFAVTPTSLFKSRFVDIVNEFIEDGIL